MNTGSESKALKHAMNVLECFTAERPELGVTELARLTGLQKSSVHTILNTFANMGYIEQKPDTLKYCLGYKLMHFSYIINSHTGLRDHFLPYLNKIADATREVCYLGMLNDLEVLYLEAAYPAAQLRSRNISGERAPLHCTGLGKAMLAFLTEDEKQKVLSSPLEKFTDYTVTNPEMLRCELDEIRSNGYAVDNMEHEFGVRCVAVPVFGNGGSVIAAVSVSGPSLRFSQQKQLEQAQLIKQTLLPLQYCF